MYTKINLMLPTYHRIENLNRIVQSVIDTTENIDNIRWTFCINEKDTQSLEWAIRAFENHDIFHVITENTRQPNLAKYFNMMYDDTVFKDAVVTMIGDDMIFKTKGWDLRVLEEINKYNGYRIVYCDDDYIAHDKCCVNMFTTRRMVDKTKKPFMCPFFHADIIDVVWTLVGKMSGTLTYLEDVIIYHDHNTRKSNELDWDETYKRLAPVQKVNNDGSNRRLAISYATIVARNIIEGGIGKWNVLQ